MKPQHRNTILIAVAGAGLLVAVTLQRNRAQHQTEAALAPVSVVGQGKAVLLELGSDRCMPCQQMMPVLAELAKAHPQQFTVAFHDVWKDSSAGEKYGISSIPTQIFFDKGGKELFRHTGFYSKEQILAKWKEFGIEISE